MRKLTYVILILIMSFSSGCTSGKTIVFQSPSPTATPLSKNLTLKELSEFSKRLELRGEDNSFLTCVYAEPEDADLNEILYSCYIAKNVGEKEEQELIKGRYITKGDLPMRELTARFVLETGKSVGVN